MKTCVGRIARTLLVSVTLASMDASAHAQTGKAPAKPLVITAATSDDTYVYVEGLRFGSDPAVFLGGMPLGGVSVNTTGTRITALKPSLDPGTYLLQVSSGEAQTENDTFDLTLGAVGPQGPAGADGADGRDGEPGAPGPPGPGLTSIEGLAQLPCVVDGAAGTVQLNTAQDGTISLKCVASGSGGPGSGTDADYLPFTNKAAYFDAFRLFAFPVQVSAAVPQYCVGDTGPGGTGACVSASPGGLSLTTDFVSFSEPDGPTPLDSLGSFAARWQFDVSTASPLNVQYQVAGISGSCAVTVQGSNLFADLGFVFDRRDPVRDVIQEDAVTVGSMDVTLSGCGALSSIATIAGDLLSNLQSLASQAAADAVAASICRARDSTVFEACPTP
jgi:hypothetical protein